MPTCNTCRAPSPGLQKKAAQTWAEPPPRRPPGIPLQCLGSCARSLGWHPAHRPSAAEEEAGRQGARTISGRPLLAAGTVSEGDPQRQGRPGPRGMQGGQSRGRMYPEGNSEFSPEGHQQPGQSGAKELSGRMEPQPASLKEGRPTSGGQTATKPPQPAAPQPGGRGGSGQHQRAGLGKDGAQPSRTEAGGAGRGGEPDWVPVAAGAAADTRFRRGAAARRGSSCASKPPPP